MVETPVVASDWVMAVAISEKSPFTEDEDMVVFGLNALFASVNVPLALRGIAASYR